MATETAKVYTFKCKVKIEHGVTHDVRICGKVITSLNKGQFEYWKLEHQAKHLAKELNIPTEEAMAMVR